MSQLVYEPIFFDPRELIPPSIWDLCGIDALNMFDPKILQAADILRDKFGPMICNTWFSPKLIKKYGHFSYRGLRPINSDIGAKKSAHKLGIKKAERYSALDLVPLKVTVSTIRVDFAINAVMWRKFISRFEKRVSWLHIDNKPTIKQQPYGFNP